MDRPAFPTGANLCENAVTRRLPRRRQYGGPLSDHPTRTALQRFLLGTLPVTELQPVVRHLMHGCESCRRVMAPFAAAVLPQPYEWNGAVELRRPAEPSEHTYDGAFARAEAAARGWGAMLERERQEARAKVPEILAQQTADGRGLALRHEPDFWTLGLVEELLARSRALRHENPAATVQYAELAKLA